MVISSTVILTWLSPVSGKLPISPNPPVASPLMLLRPFIENWTPLILTLPVTWAEPPRVTISALPSAPAPPKVILSALIFRFAPLPVQVTLLSSNCAPASREPTTFTWEPFTLILLSSPLLRIRTPEPTFTAPVPLILTRVTPAKSKPCCWYLSSTSTVRPKLIVPPARVKPSPAPVTNTRPL